MNKIEIPSVCPQCGGEDLELASELYRKKEMVYYTCKKCGFSTCPDWDSMKGGPDWDSMKGGKDYEL